MMFVKRSDATIRTPCASESLNASRGKKLTDWNVSESVLGLNEKSSNGKSSNSSALNARSNVRSGSAFKRSEKSFAKDNSEWKKRGELSSDPSCLTEGKRMHISQSGGDPIRLGQNTRVPLAQASQ